MPPRIGPRQGATLSVHRVAGGLLALAPLLPLVYAVAAEPFRPVLRRRDIVVPWSWPALSILHLSDLHVRTAGTRLVRAQMALIGGLEPDLLVVTGDLCETPDDVEPTVQLLSSVRPRFGTFVILGNHEHDAHHPVLRSSAPWWARLADRLLGLAAPTDVKEPGQASLIAQGLGQAGITVLLNRGARVRVRGRTLWIAGCDSAWAGRADVASAMRGRAPGESCVALVHEPELAFPVEALGADLTLAGHTHGGQVRLPVLGSPITHRVDQRVRIAAGLQQLDIGQLHISAGFGQTIPLRFGCPPEAVWLDCLPAGSQAHLDPEVPFARYAGPGGPNQVRSASCSPSWVPSPTQAT